MRHLAELIERIDAADFAALSAAEGRDWIASLGERVNVLLDRWKLRLVGDELGHGYHSVVIATTGPTGPSVLKLVWPPALVIDEEASLRAWAGRGAVLVHEADAEGGAILLERLDATRTLEHLPLEEAAVEAAVLLHEMSIDAPDDVPKLADVATTMSEIIAERQHLLSDRDANSWAVLARSLLLELGEVAGRTLVHTDLHYGNVLAGTRRPWIAIDPKPLAGDPERAVAEMLWTRADELEDDNAIRHLLDIIVDAARLDGDKAARWAVARTVDYWLWALTQGLTVDPHRCHRVVRALAAQARS